MEKDKFSTIKKQVQEIIDLIGDRNQTEANKKLTEVSEQLEELLDFSVDDQDLMQIGRYQVLLDQLNQRIIELNGQFKK